MAAAQPRRTWPIFGAILVLLIPLLSLAVGSEPATAQSTEAQYVALAPSRILDTRNATDGDYATPWAPGQTRAVQVTNVGGVPGVAVASVSVHITTVNATAPISWLTVTPTGDPVSTTAVLNFGTDASGHTLTNDLVIAKVGTGGQIDITNQAGNVDIVIDVVGYHTTTPGGTFLQAGPDIDGAAANDRSGASVALNDAGNRVAISSLGARMQGGERDGSVRVFEEIGGTWVQLGADIDPPLNIADFGWVVDLNAAGDRVAIGAPGKTHSGALVQIFEWDGGAWNQLGSDLEGVENSDEFGTSVAINDAGDRVIVGAPFHNGTGLNNGHARVYEWNGTAWSQLGADIDGAAVTQTGGSVAINGAGDRIAVGAAEADGTHAGSGNTRIFSWTGSTWSQLGSPIEGEATLDHSGRAVALNGAGDRVAIGADSNSAAGSSAGQVHVFEWNGATWNKLGDSLYGEAAGDRFGRAIAMNTSGSTIAVGAELNDGSGDDAGHVRLYEWTGTAWAQVGIDIDAEAAGDLFGEAVALDAAGTRIAAGGSDNAGAAFDAGHTRVFDVAPEPTKFNSVPSARLLDSRNNTQGAYETPWAPGQTRTVQITGPGAMAGVPAAAASVVMNITTVNATAPSSWLTVTPAGEPASTTAVLNYGTDPSVHGITNDLVIAKLSDSGAIDITNAAGTVDIVIDVVGYHVPGSGSNFVAIPAARILDSRNSIEGTYDTPWTTGQTRAVPVTGFGGVPNTGVESVVVHITTVNATAPGSWLTVAPSGNPLTDTANSNFGTDATSHTITNDIVIVKVGAGGQIDITNALGDVDIVIDIVGYHT